MDNWLPPSGQSVAPVAPAVVESTASTTASNVPGRAGTINRTLFKCRKCKILFWESKEAAAHEETCDEPPWFGCGVCHVLRFRTREERLAHQATCPGLHPLRVTDLPLAESIINDQAGSGGKGDGGKEKNPPPIKEGVSGGGEGETGETPAKTNNGVVDLTESPPSPTVGSDVDAGLAVDGAKISGGDVKSPAKQPSRSGATKDEGNGGESESSSSVEVIEKSATPDEPSATKQNGGIGDSDMKGTYAEGDTEVDGEMKPAELSANKKNDKGGDAKMKDYQTVWTCDVCKVKQFYIYEEAVEHEKQCMLVKNGKKGEGKGQDPSPSKKSDRLLTFFSPILKDASESSNFSLISEYHKLILKSLKLLCPSKANAAVSFQCQFCSYQYQPLGANYWTLNEITHRLPDSVFKHLIESDQCPSVTDKVMARLPKAKRVTKMQFEEFVAGFFAENGVVQLQDQGVVVLSEEDFKKMPGSGTSKRQKKKRAKAGEAKAKGNKRQKASKSTDKSQTSRSVHKEIKYADMGCRLHSEDGHLFRLGPTNGLPFISSFSQVASQRLHISEKFLLQQLELFTPLAEIMKQGDVNAPSQSVGIRCRNCISQKNACCFMSVSSVDAISRDVLLMAVEHLVSCKFMKVKEVKLIQDLEGRDHSELDKYCKLVAKLYCLEDAKESGDGNNRGVVWGESPQVPGNYNTPADLDVSMLVTPAAPKSDDKKKLESPPSELVTA